MSRLWDILDEDSRAVCRSICGKRWREPVTRPALDDIPVDISREMTRRPTGDAALIGDGHGR